MFVFCIFSTLIAYLDYHYTEGNSKQRRDKWGKFIYISSIFVMDVNINFEIKYNFLYFLTFPRVLFLHINNGVGTAGSKTDDLGLQCRSLFLVGGLRFCSSSSHQWTRTWPLTPTYNWDAQKGIELLEDRFPSNCRDDNIIAQPSVLLITRWNVNLKFQSA